jgi:hypothetical protein
MDCVNVVDGFVGLNNGRIGVKKFGRRMDSVANAFLLL